MNGGPSPACSCNHLQLFCPLPKCSLSSVCGHVWSVFSNARVAVSDPPACAESTARAVGRRLLARRVTPGLVILLALFVSAAPSLGSSDEADPLTFWVVAGTVEDADMYRELARRFSEETGAGPVEITPLGWGNYNTKYLTAMAAGEPPDLGVTALTGPFWYGTVGGVIDFREAFPGRIEAFEERFFPNLMPSFRWEGKLFGVPADLTTLLVYYRTDVFERLGLPAPRTWRDLRNAVRAVEADGRRFLYGWSGGYQYGLSQFTMAYGLPSYSGGGAVPEVNWHHDKYRDAVAEAAWFWYMHGDDEGELTERAVGQFKTDDPRFATPITVDLAMNYVRLIQLAPEIEGRWDCVPWPKASDGRPASAAGGRSYVIFQESDRQEEAFELLRFLTSLESQRFMLRHKLDRGEASQFHVSPLKAFWSSDHTELWDDPNLAEYRRMAEVMREAVPTISTTPLVHGAIEVERIEQTKVLDRLDADINQWLIESARARGVSRRAFIEGMASGAYAAEASRFDQRIRERVDALYEQWAPPANNVLEEAAENYERRFGNVVEQLDVYRKRLDVLTIAEIVVGVLLVAGVISVAALRGLRRHAVSYAFIGLPVGLVSVFVFIPAAVALVLSLTEYHPVLPLSSATWHGLGHYADLFTESELILSVARTFQYVVLWLPITLALSLVIAALLNRPLVGQRWWRFAFFCPLVTSVVSITLVFAQLFRSTPDGWLNTLLLQTGVVDSPMRFTNSEDLFMYCVVIVGVWAGMAFNVLIYLAGLQQIPASLYEAATVDGAGWFQRLRHVSIPGLRPQILFTAIIGLIIGFQVFEPIYMLGGGTNETGSKFGPNDAGMTLAPLVFHYGFERFQMGVASAMAYVLFVLILLFTMLQMRVLREEPPR